jgi:membrane-bound ClpP family serine protease
MKAKHALYLGLIIIGAAFLLIDATVLGFIFEAAGLVLLLISALMEWASEHQDPHP